MSINAFTSLVRIQGIAQELGIDEWQLQQGSYNGYIFHVVDNVLDQLNKNYNPLDPAINEIRSLASNATKKSLGVSAKDSTTIPFGAGIGSTQIQDRVARKIAINPLPNGKDNIQQLGYSGQMFSILGILWGSTYLEVRDQMQKMMYSDDDVLANNPNEYHVLNHPILGRIKNCWLIEMQHVNISSVWRGALYRLVFRSEEPLRVLQKNVNNKFSEINNIISSILAIAFSIVNFWNDINLIRSLNVTLKTLKSNIIIEDQLNVARTSVLSTVNSSVVATKLLVNNLAPNINNLELKNYPANINDYPDLFYYQSHSSPNDINNLNKYINSITQTTIKTLNINNIRAFYQESINNIRDLSSTIGQLCLSLINSYYGQIMTYITPRDMSLYDVCFVNNLNYDNNYQKILNLNKEKSLLLNYIPKGYQLLIPNRTLNG